MKTTETFYVLRMRYGLGHSLACGAHGPFRSLATALSFSPSVMPKSPDHPLIRTEVFLLTSPHRDLPGCLIILKVVLRDDVV